MTNLTGFQEQVLDLLAKSKLKKIFYWSGGTALSVYLKHRKSEDLDFFSDKPFRNSLLVDFIDDIKNKNNIKIVEEKKVFDRWIFFLHNHQEIRLEFVHYDHPQLNKRTFYRGVSVDSLDDIATNKLMALFDRNEPKDAIDLYYILTKGKYKIETILKFVQKKFGVKFEESQVWSETLKAAKDAHQIKPLLTEKNATKKIETFFAAQSKKYLDNILD